MTLNLITVYICIDPGTENQIWEFQHDIETVGWILVPTQDWLKIGVLSKKFAEYLRNLKMILKVYCKPYQFIYRFPILKYILKNIYIIKKLKVVMEDNKQREENTYPRDRWSLKTIKVTNFIFYVLVPTDTERGGNQYC